MPETVPLDHVAFGVPTHADVLVAVSSDDVFLVGREQESGEEGDMSEDELAVGGVLV